MNGAQSNIEGVGANLDNGKPEIYEALAHINLSLQAVLDNLDKLKAVQALSPVFAERARLIAEQLRSEINLTASIRLHTSECGHASFFQRQLLTLEKQLLEIPALPLQSEIAVLPSPAFEDQQSEEDLQPKPGVALSDARVRRAK